ncbi:MAG TPA: DUF1801 domain-containing protein [Acidimicrobiales bacterium]|nr:DUF1801 domain-containing protein [Acidimicrobiales bacterium]
MAKSAEPTPSQLIDGRIRELDDWRGEMLSRLRDLIKEAVPGVVEEWKWRGVPTWYDNGIICTGETYKEIVKLTFAKGAKVNDPAGLFNSSLEGNVRRAIDFRQGDKINVRALKSLFRAAAALNHSK